MKFRTNFVSNSSSSSFVVLGAKVSKPDGFDNWDYHAQDKWCDTHLYIEEDDAYLAGIWLTDSDENGLDSAKLSLVELAEKAKQVSEEFGIPLAEIAIHMGTRSC